MVSRKNQYFRKSKNIIENARANTNLFAQSKAAAIAFSNLQYVSGTYRLFLRPFSNFHCIINSLKRLLRDILDIKLLFPEASSCFSKSFPLSFVFECRIMKISLAYSSEALFLVSILLRLESLKRLKREFYGLKLIIDGIKQVTLLFLFSLLILRS